MVSFNPGLSSYSQFQRFGQNDAGPVDNKAIAANLEKIGGKIANVQEQIAEVKQVAAKPVTLKDMQRDK